MTFHTDMEQLIVNHEVTFFVGRIGTMFYCEKEQSAAVFTNGRNDVVSVQLVTEVTPDRAEEIADSIA